MEASEAFPPSKLRIHYDLLHELCEGEQTALARFRSDKTYRLATRFESSVKQTLNSPRISNLIYGELDEDGAIIDDRSALPVIVDPHQIDSTDPFAAYIKNKAWTVEGPSDLTFTYVDRELSPLRITEQGGARPSVRWLDLLLREHEAGQPIVTELKVRRDSLPYYALTQALMYAADLCGRNQFERLNQLLPGDAKPFVWHDDRPSLDVAVIFFEPPESGWSNWDDSLGATKTIVANLNKDPRVNRVVGQIRLIEGTIVKDEIIFKTIV
ncbi:MAG: hypothetical protein WBQ66_13000 [Blastocatellia bacterium]